MLQMPVLFPTSLLWCGLEVTVASVVVTQGITAAIKLFLSFLIAR